MNVVATESLIGAQLDWAVAVAENKQFMADRIVKLSRNEETTPQWVERETAVNSYRFVKFSPSIAEEGNSIIKRESITVEFLPESEVWWAKSPKNESGLIRHSNSGPTALIAAMRCYVASQLGPNVQLAPNL